MFKVKTFPITFTFNLFIIYTPQLSKILIFIPTRCRVSYFCQSNMHELVYLFLECKLICKTIYIAVYILCLESENQGAFYKVQGDFFFFHLESVQVFPSFLPERVSSRIVKLIEKHLPRVPVSDLPRVQCISIQFECALFAFLWSMWYSWKLERFK